MYCVFYQLHESSSAPKSSRITSVFRSLHWLKINERIDYKLLSLTYKVLTTSQPDYLHNLISVQSTGRTRSSSAVTLVWPSVSSSLEITNLSFRYESPYLWNRLLSSFHQPRCVHSPPGLPHPAHITLSQSLSSLSSSMTSLAFSLRNWNLSAFQILSTIVFLISSDCLHGSLYRTKWALAFVCFSFVC